jgi:hypothetical protein
MSDPLSAPHALDGCTRCLVPARAHLAQPWNTARHTRLIRRPPLHVGAEVR